MSLAADDYYPLRSEWRVFESLLESSIINSIMRHKVEQIRDLHEENIHINVSVSIFVLSTWLDSYALM